MKSSERMEQIRPLWEQGLGITEISKVINITTPNVCLYLDMLYGKSREKRFIYKRRIHSFNDNFFKIINSEASAYFLGFLAADGNIGSDNNTIRLGLHEKDKEILECFKKHLEYSGELRYIKKEKEKGWNRSNQYQLVLTSPIMRKDLISQGVGPNKSLNIEFPNNIPKDFLWHYLRGYFDGDGCFSFNIQTNRAEISIAGSMPYCNSLISVLNEFNISVRVSKHQTNNCYYARINGGNNMMRFYNLLYKDSTIYLHRKKDIFDNWITEKNRRIVKYDKTVLQYDMNDNFIREWKNATEASEILHKPVLASQISQCCRGKSKQTGGFKWKYKTYKYEN